MADLAPPKVESEDSGAHELEAEQPSSDTSTTSTQQHQDTPGGLPIPKTVVEKVEPENPSHGEVPGKCIITSSEQHRLMMYSGTAAFDIRTEDAAPDEVRTAPDITRANLEGVL